MNETEKMEFCRNTTFLAKGLGIGIRRLHSAGRYEFAWFDMGFIVSCPSETNEKDALVSACKSLLNHFNPSART